MKKNVRKNIIKNIKKNMKETVFIYVLLLINVMGFTVSYADNPQWDATNQQAQALGALLAGQGGNATGNESGNNLMDSIGVSASTVGNRSSMSRDNMGVTGVLSATFDFTIKNHHCTFDQHRTALHGTYFIIPCAKDQNNEKSEKGEKADSSVIAALMCVESSQNGVNCDHKKHYKSIKLPINNHIVTEYGYDITGHCDSSNHCQAKVTQKSQTITNADSINQQAATTAQNSDMHSMIANGYLGKEGYSDHQSYMKSFGDKGENNIFAQCNKKIDAIFSDGMYYNCQGNENDTFDAKGKCITQQICTQWKMIDHEDISYQNCRLMADDKDQLCNRVTRVSIYTRVIPPKDLPFSGTGATDWRSEAYHSGAHFTFPYSGILKSFHITSHGNWMGHFWIHIPPIVDLIDTRYGGIHPRVIYGAPQYVMTGQNPISFAYPHLAIPVTQGQQGQLSADGREYAHVPDMTINYNGVIEIPQSIEKYPVTTTEIQC
jgi:hypothetical protein